MKNKKRGFRTKNNKLVLESPQSKIVFSLVVLALAVLIATSVSEIVSYNAVKLSPSDELQIDENSIEHEGYIVEFKEKPLAVISKELDSSIVASSYKKQRLNEQKNKITIERENFKNKLKTVSPKAKIRKEFNVVFNGVSISNDITNQQLEELKKDLNVKRISPNYKIKLFLNESVPLINADDVWKLDAQGNNCTQSGQECLTGKGVTIGIIDTGVDYNHPDLGGCFGEGCKVVGGWDFVNEDGDPFDDFFHGTHVAATAAGNGILKGVAPDASIVAYKVLNSQGIGTEDNIISAIDRSVDPNQDGDYSDHLGVISLSLGGGGNPDSPGSVAIDNAVGLDVVAVVSAGNSGPGERTIGSPGTARKAITVGAIDKNLSIAKFSSRGPVIWKHQELFQPIKRFSIIKPDIVAPGVNIYAASPNMEYKTLSGTSMSAPHVSGLAALIKQKNDNWSAEQIKSAIKNSAIILQEPEKVNIQGFGGIDAYKALFDYANPLIVSIDPIQQDSFVINITGKIIGDNFYNYKLFYVRNAPLGNISESEHLIISSNLIPSEGLLFANFKPFELAEGEYLIKLEVVDNFGNKFYDYGYFEVNKFDFVNISYFDVYNPKSPLDFRVKNIYNFEIEDFHAEYSFDGTQWRNYGVHTEIENLTVSIAQNSINLSGDLFIKINISENNISNLKYIQIYSDTSLKENWPIRLNFPLGIFGKPTSLGKIKPSVDDVTGDGKDEIVIFAKKADILTILIFNLEGNLISEIPVGGSSPLVELDFPLLVDIDKDGVKDIVVSINDTETGNSAIYAYNFDGNIIKGWPLEIDSLGGKRNLLLTAYDIDFDGKVELIARDKINDGEGEKIFIVNSSGYIENEIVLPENNLDSSFSKMIFYPSIGNFDNDTDFEIVVIDFPRNLSDSQIIKLNGIFIFIFNKNGSIVDNFPINLSGIPIQPPIIADFDKDGKMEIIIGLNYNPILTTNNSGGVYVINEDGEILPGWPALKGKRIKYYSIGDINEDGNLEVIAMDSNNIYILNSSGDIVSNRSYNGDSSLIPIYHFSTTSGNNLFFSSDILFDGSYLKGKVDNMNLNLSIINQKMTESSRFVDEKPLIIKDIDGDNYLEIISASSLDYDPINGKNKERASIYIWETNVSSSFINWGEYQHDPQHTGCYKCLICGNSLIEAGEQCDDGNLNNPDGCSSICQIQDYFECSGQPSICKAICTDSDGGDKPYRKGIVNIEAYRINVQDSCFNSTMVREYICDWDAIRNETIANSKVQSCNTWCTDGYCTSSPLGGPIPTKVPRNPASNIQ